MRRLVYDSLHALKDSTAYLSTLENMVNIPQKLRGSVELMALYNSEDGMQTFYELMPDAPEPTHIRHSGSLTRSALRYDAGASGLNNPVRSVLIRFRKYGLPTGNITVNIRKGSDDTVAATIGTSLRHFLQE